MTLAIAAPLAAANLAQMTIGFTNRVMAGRLGGVPLAAAGAAGRGSPRPPQRNNYDEMRPMPDSVMLIGQSSRGYSLLSKARGGRSAI